MAQHFGSPDKHQVGVVFQRSLFISGITALVSGCVLLNVEWILQFTHQSSEVSILTAKYAKISAIGLHASFLNLQLQKLLLCQSIIWPILGMFVFLDVLIAVLHALFIFVLDLGVVGSALATSVGFWIADVAFIMYIIWKRLHENVWGGWTKACLLDWWSYVKLGVPGLLMTCLEWGAFEVTIIIAAFRGDTTLAAQVILEQVVFLMLSTWTFGLQIASSIRVGNYLGSGNYFGAKTVYILTIAMTAIGALFVGSLVAALHSLIPYAFTSEPDVVALCSTVLPQMIVFHFSDAIQNSFCGLARGTGKQLFGAIIAFIAYVVIGLPIGSVLFLMTFLQLQGLWIGFNIAGFFQATSYFILFWRVSWEKEAKLAAARIEEERQLHRQVKTSGPCEFTRLEEETNFSSTDESVTAPVIINDDKDASGREEMQKEGPQTTYQQVFTLRWFLLYRLPVLAATVLLLVSAICLSIFVKPQYSSIISFSNSSTLKFSNMSSSSPGE